MNIYEATKIAIKENKCITRSHDMWWNLKIKPTNGKDNCIMMDMDGLDPFGGWQPNVEDLMATDWKAIDYNTRRRNEYIRSNTHSGNRE